MLFSLTIVLDGIWEGLYKTKIGMDNPADNPGPADGASIRLGGVDFASYGTSKLVSFCRAKSFALRRKPERKTDFRGGLLRMKGRLQHATF